MISILNHLKFIYNNIEWRFISYKEIVFQIVGINRPTSTSLWTKELRNRKSRSKLLVFEIDFTSMGIHSLRQKNTQNC